ncbi:MAG TPA: hypothetical protein VNF71_00055 [Acidimicrobiales bacterium]|nr:hypothetical protein [Acidimicrobiales bacterium]
MTPAEILDNLNWHFATLEHGTRRLMRMVEQMADAPVESLATRIIEELCGDASDDCCVLIFRRRH